MTRPRLIVKDLVKHKLTQDQLQHCIRTASALFLHMIDRKNLHRRDDLEKFINVLMGEVAEMMVLRWLQEHGKYAQSAVDKGKETPDPGHDLWVIDRQGERRAKASVKSSISAKLNLERILSEMKLATTKAELRDFNIQVYFWLTIDPPAGDHRVVVPSIEQSAIICWFADNDLQTGSFSAYNREHREAPQVPLSSGRAMVEFLDRVADRGEFTTLEVPSLHSVRASAPVPPQPICQGCGKLFTPRKHNAPLCIDCWKKRNTNRTVPLRE